MKTSICKLSPRQKAALLSVAYSEATKGSPRAVAVKAIVKKMYALKVVENSGDYNAALSVALSFFEMEKAKRSGQLPITCLPAYAAFKQASAEHFSDFGAFGDFIETVLRCSCKPVNLVKFTDLHVKRAEEVDIVIKGKKCEVGTNGKTFSKSTEFDCIGEEVDYIVYGVFTDEEKAALYTLAINGELTRLFDEVRSMLYVFTPENFPAFLGEKGFKYKAPHWQVIHNPGRMNKFITKVEEEGIPTVKDMF